MLKGWFFRHFAADPFFNMAFDEWMFSYALATPGAILLRLYTWRVGAITFGYNQRRETALDFSQVGTTPVIRRITGGRAVYHDPSELTYSFAVNPRKADVPSLSGSIAAVSSRLADALSAFLASMGMAATIVRHSSVENSRPDFFHKAPCFASHARDELVSGGYKIVASAQRRHGMAWLQHGAIKLSGLAEHPALAFVHEVDSIEPKPLTEDEYGSAASLFKREIEAVLGIRFMNKETSFETKAVLSKAAAQLRIAPFARRDLF